MSQEEDRNFEQWWEKVEAKKLTPEQREFLAHFSAYWGKCYGRGLTYQQQHLAVVQAEMIGDL
jgi:hypothetical protein